MFKFISKQTELDEPVYGLEVLKELHDAEYISFDFETTGVDIFTLTPVLLGLETGTTYDKHGAIVPGNTYIIDFLTFGIQEVAECLRPLMGKLWIAHNLVFDYQILEYHFNIKLRNVHCTMLASQVLFNGADAITHNYKATVNRHFDVIINKDDVQSFIDRDLSLPIKRNELEYLRKDLFYLKALYDRQMKLGSPEKKDLWKCFELENNFIRVMSHLMLNGVSINGHKWIENTEMYIKEVEKSSKQIKDKAEQLCEEFQIYDVVPNKKKYDKQQISLFEVQEMTSIKRSLAKFNPKSTIQILKFLNRLQVKIEAVGEDDLKKALYDIKNPSIKEFIKELLNLRKYEKLVSTYGLKFLNQIHPVTMRLHSSYMQCFTDTGRLSSSKVNLQNVPGRKEIRECFVPDSEEYSFVSLDLSGQELRLAASISQDIALLKSFNEGLDLHSFLAQDTFRIIYNDPNFIVSKKENENLRNDHKPVLFSYIFGGGARRISEVLDIPMPLAKKVFDKLEANLYGLSQYQKRMKKKVLIDGFVVDGTKYNRRQSFNFGRLKPLLEHQIEKKGINFPMQAGGASMLKEASIKILDFIEDNKLDAKIKLSVHDELVIQFLTRQKKLPYKFKEIMEEVGSSYLVGLGMESSMNVAPFWQK